MSVRVERVTEPVNLLALGAETGSYWRSEWIELAGIGSAVAVPVDEAAAYLAALGSHGAIGPVGFAALSFSPRDSDRVFVPPVSVQRHRSGEVFAVSSDGSDPLAALAGLGTPGRSMPGPTAVSVRSVVEPTTWCDTVRVARDEIRRGRLNKVVLSRELKFSADRDFIIEPILDRLATRFPAAMIFCVEGFVGASPELLVARHDTTVQARPLAGTAPRGAGPEDDRRIAAGLIASTKDQTEHRITIEWFLNELLPFCSYVDAEPEPSLITVANLHHLQTVVEGVLSTPAAPILELVHAVHPTPALGGDPAPVALEVIADLEVSDRGRYGGPVGWLDGNGDGEFAVGIRSAQISGASAAAFAGVGIVGASDPDQELAETKTKFEVMLDALVRL